MKEIRFIIQDKDGIHARPAGNLVKEAGKYTSTITIKKGDKTGDLKRIFAVMGLGAKCGDEIIIQAEGADEEAAAEALQKFLQENL